jgi:hypothetical protein
MSKTSLSIWAQALRPTAVEASRINYDPNTAFRRSVNGVIAALALACAPHIAFGSSTSIYITQNTSGSDTGVNAANAHSVAWFNNSANWGSGATQIGPGTTVHLTGTFSGAAGTTMLTPPGSGAAGAPVTILFDSGCVLTSPCWAVNGAIYLNGVSYIDVDGGANGVITNTSNGTGLAYSVANKGVYIYGCSYINIRNLTIGGLYKNLGNNSAATDPNGDGSYDIYTDGNLNYVHIYSNSVFAAKAGIGCAYGLADHIEIDHNYSADHCWGMVVGGIHGSSSSATNVKIHDNEITDWSNWAWPSDSFHTDGMIIWASTGHTFAPEIYNNYIHGGFLGGSPTAFIFVTYDGDPSATMTALVHDNLLVPNNWSTAIWTQVRAIGCQFYNNTIVGPGAGGGIAVVQQGANSVFKNNIFVGVATALTAYYQSSTAIASSDNNVFYNVNNVASDNFFSGAGPSYSMSTWRSTYGFDGNSLTTDPKLSSSYHLQSGSSAIGLGANMSSLFGTDRDGNLLPSSGAWDAGVYQFSTTISTNPVLTVTPTSLNLAAGLVGSVSTNFFTVQNTGSGTLAGVASVTLPFHIVPGSGSYSLGSGQSHSVGVYCTNRVAGVTNGTATFTGGGGFTAPVTATATNLPPQVSAISQSGIDVDPNIAGLQVYAGSVVQYSGTSTDPGGLPLTWQWLYSLNGAADVTVQSGSGTVTPVSYNYTVASIGNTYVWKLRVSNGTSTAESDLTVGVEAAPSSTTNLLFGAAAATISGPFALDTGGALSQTVETGVSTGGRAVFNFTITNSGTFVVQGLVNAASDAGNSFYLNIDADPTDPTTIWDIPLTSGFEQRIASWRGNGTPTSSQFVPKMFDLAAGAHQLILVGREANTQLEQVALLQVPPPPQNFRIVHVGP